MSESDATVVYHASCCDGFCAAWVMRKKYPEAVFHAAQHGDPPPDVTGRRVFLVDFCYKRPEMLRIIESAKSVTVLDHHRTAEAALSDLDGILPPGAEKPVVVVFDMNKSGGRLTWEYLFPGEVSPWLVDYTEDRDLWRHALDNTLAVNAALRSYPLDFVLWDELARIKPGPWSFGEHWHVLVAGGEAILRDQKKTVDAHVSFAAEVEFAGHKVLAVNATTLVSEIAGELAKGRPFGLVYFDTAGGKRVYNLRSDKNGVDVSEIAKARGGGGHARAAGFDTPRPGPLFTGQEKA